MGQYSGPCSHSWAVASNSAVANGVVVIGNGGSEYGVRGYVSAYDAATGARHFFVAGAIQPHFKLDRPVAVKTIEAFNVSPPPTSAIAGQSTGITLDEQIFVERGEIVAMTGLQPTVLPEGRLQPLIEGLGVVRRPECLP